MKTIFLDFDGVLFDSVKEAYLLARYAYYDVPVKEKIDEKHYNMFKKYRYLITHSWHYYYILSLMENKVVNKKNYLESINNRDEKKDSIFDKKYQKERQRLILEDKEFWKNLDSPYPFFYKMKRLSTDYNIVILSTKNEEAILEHLNDYNFKIDSDKIIGKEKLKNYNSKADFLQKYIKENNITKAIFIDDSNDNLSLCKNIDNLICIQAKWGYVPIEEACDNSDEILNLMKNTL